MRFFAFGLGHSALRLHELFPQVKLSGTCRETEKQKILCDSGIDAVRFDNANDVAKQFSQADNILISIPPQADIGDAVWHHYADLIAAHPKKYYCYLSSTGIYGNHHGAWVDETTRPQPSQTRTKSRLAAERQWQQRVGNLVIFRLAGIYGYTRNVLLDLRAGHARAIVKYDSEGRKQIFSRIHVDDIASAIDFAMRKKLCGIYNLCDDCPSPPDEIMHYGAKLLGVSAPPVQNFEDIRHELSEMAQSFYQDNKCVSNKKIKQAGFQFAYPDYQTGLSSLID